MVYVILSFVLLFERTEINNVDMLKIALGCIIYAADSLIHTLRRVEEFWGDFGKDGEQIYIKNKT